MTTGCFATTFGKRSFKTEAANGAGLLVDGLIAAGIPLIFGVPGDTGIALYEALYQRADRIRHVLARDERAAAAMADGYARTGHRLGVVEASSGGGVTYLVGGLGEAYAASIPLLVLTSDIARQSRGTGAVTEIDQGALLSAVTKWQRTVDSADDIPRLLAEAIGMALGGRPGPVSLVFPEDVLSMPSAAVPTAIPTVLPPVRPEAPEEAVALVARALSEATHPAILAGSGVHLSAAWEELRALAHDAGVPVATTIHGKGAFAETDALALGVVGANGAHSGANTYLEQADWVLLVGTRANATDTDGFRAPPRQGCFIAQIDIDASRAGRNYPSAVPLPGDAGAVLRQLGREIRSLGMRHAAIDPPPRPVTAEEVLKEERVPAGALHPGALVMTLQEAVQPGTLVTADAGTPTPWLASLWRCDTAGRSVLVPRGHGPMGFALPAAVGGALASPGAPVLCVTTDGSLAMCAGELETVHRLQLPITIVHLANHSYGWIKMLQHLYADRHYLGVDFSPVQADLVARGFGLSAERVGSLEDLGRAVASAQAEGRPHFIDVQVPSEEALPPPVSPWQRTLQGLGGRAVY